MPDQPSIDPVEIALRVKAQREAEKNDPRPLPTESKELPTLDVDMVEIPDVVGMMSGWRAWQIKDHVSDSGEVLLQSVTHGDFVWPPRQFLEATCNRNAGKDPIHVPGWSCSCGLYAAKGRRHLLDKMNYAMYREGFWRVIGEVKLWGRVIEGTQGWRAQKGYPSKLFVPYEANYLAVPLMRTYGVPVALANWLK